MLDDAGPRADALASVIRRRLGDPMGPCVSNVDGGHARTWVDEIDRHLDDTHFDRLRRRP